jgi:hypothetical protein
MRRKKGGQIWPMTMYYPGHLGGSSPSINRQKISYCNAKLYLEDAGWGRDGGKGVNIVS